MTDWRTLSAFAALALCLGLTASPALGQSTAPPTGALPDTDPADEAQIEANPGADLEAVLRPQSPAEEAARRQARLDGLFARLAQKDNPSWEEAQSEIWRLWTHSGSDSMDLLLLRADNAVQGGDLELALRFLDDLVRLAPDFPEAWNKRATVYFLLNEYGHSVADIERVLALEPRHFGALSGLAIILERLGDKEGAMRAFRRGLEIHPNLKGANEGVERLAPDVDGREL